MSDDEPRKPQPWTYLVGGLVAGMFVIDLLRPRTRREREQEQERRRKGAAEKAERDRRRAIERAFDVLIFRFWLPGEEGRRLLDAQTLRLIPIADPYPDTVVTPGVPRNGWTLASAAAGLTLEVSWIVQDGWLTLTPIIEGTRTASIEFTKLWETPLFVTESDRWDLLGKAARLLVGRLTGTLQVRRTDWRQFQLVIWEDHLRAHPDIAQAIGWTGAGPYRQLQRGLWNTNPFK